METADFDYKDFETGQQAQGDATLLVKFYLKSTPDAAKSAAEGRPMFKEVEYVDIKIPGSRTGGACRPARQKDLERFPRHYAAFKNRIEEPNDGTPLAEWPAISRSQADELAFFNVKTVEQLAEMSDTNAGQFMGMNALREKAKAWLAKAAEGAPALALAAVVAEKDAQIAMLSERLNALEGNAPNVTSIEPPTNLPPSALDVTAGMGEVDAPDVAPEVKPPARKKRKRKARKVSDG